MIILQIGGNPPHYICFMSEKQYHILYFHGLDSSLTLNKRQAMEAFGNVTAPHYDYRNPKVLEAINTNFEYDEHTVMIGSSFGGYLADIFSAKYDIPCLLFNPALALRSIPGMADRPEDLTNNISNLSYVVLGKKDTVISAELSRAYINRHFTGPKEIVTEPNMKHRVPLPLFTKHVKGFFRMLAENKAPT